MRILRTILSAAALGALIVVGFMYTVAFGSDETYLHNAPYTIVEEPIDDRPVQIFTYYWTMQDDRYVDLWERYYYEDFVEALDEAVVINERRRREHRKRFAPSSPQPQE